MDRPVNDSVGAVIVFKAGTDLPKAQRFLDELLKRGIIESRSTPVGFPSVFGPPVFYLP